MDTQEFRYLRITGDISIEPAHEKVPRLSVQYLIMGPTGAGKSSVSSNRTNPIFARIISSSRLRIGFVEALAPRSQQLSISKDQLAGVTQHVTAYKLVNVSFLIATLYHPIYLIDTPGFSDPEISEVEIMGMVREWFKANDLSQVQGILFLTPVNGTRLAGTKRRTIEMLRSFVRPSNSLGSIVFVTTIWNMIHNPRTQQRAESNFAQLRDEIFNEFIDKGAVIAQFMNTKPSALQILDNIIWRSNSFFNDESGISPHLYQDLHERIESALQQKKTIEANLCLPDTQSYPELKSILEKNYKENQDILIKFIGQLIVFGHLPLGCEHAAQRLRKSIVESGISYIEYQATFEMWYMEAELPKELHQIDHAVGVDDESQARKALVMRGWLRPLFRAPHLRPPKKWFTRRK